ncbi:PhzF family phenazine biosynthesis protein [Streptomyces sp. NPDC002825]|uniref:PhzF family phenazine biosynthesis protein n=1 Tax=Streptomyces sp. NPDC002825 TaxID=3154666 RepID=UPI00331E03FE
MFSREPSPTVVHACVRDGRGGSPTAVLDDGLFGDDERRRLPGAAGASHAVFVSPGPEQDGLPLFSLRFFTSAGELPSCGHGTIAALGYLAARAGADSCRVLLRVAGRTFPARAVRRGTYVEAEFAYGSVELREPEPGQGSEPALTALGIRPDALGPGIRVASVGRPRLLVPVTSRAVLAALAPDMERLRAACDRLGLLGCYVYSAPSPSGRAAARMFAPSIGVPEDIANANSTACLAAHLAGAGIDRITVDMGDSLGSPATIRAGMSGSGVRLGGDVLLTGALP